MRITGRLADSCPNGISCARVHDTDGDHVLVQGDVVTPVPDGVTLDPDEGLVSVPRWLLYDEPMTVDQMVDWIFARHERDIIRVETRREYLVDSDGDDFARYLRGESEPNAEAKAPWLNLLATHARQRPPRRWRRVHIVPAGEPLTDYERYEFEWGFTYNTAAGEDVRILESGHGELAGVPDFFVIEGQHVIRSVYDEVGRHIGGVVVHGPDAAVYRSLAAGIWRSAVPFLDWWAAHPQFHRAAHAA